MSIIHNYCITSKYHHYLNDLKIKIILSGAEQKDLDEYPNDWIKDNEGINISKKNSHFGTLTSHYWLWKNKLKSYEDNDFIGINHYRRFWIKKNNKDEINLNNLSDNILRNTPDDNYFDVLLPQKIFLKDLKLSKLIKKGFKNYIKNPFILFQRNKYNIKTHFDLFHGYNLISKASELLNSNDKEDFINYINTKNSFYPLQIFVVKKKFLVNLYEYTFDWIFKCEKIFSNIKLVGYGKERLYDFLAERYFSFYFEKYTKIKTWPFIVVKDK
tara:strand:- start:986 stop:1798 length:813 start_codon:yes stop_codon:yes gene_type:complete